jgi:hypothetical protein
MKPLYSNIRVIYSLHSYTTSGAFPLSSLEVMEREWAMASRKQSATSFGDDSEQDSSNEHEKNNDDGGGG